MLNKKKISYLTRANKEAEYVFNMLRDNRIAFYDRSLGYSKFRIDYESKPPRIEIYADYNFKTGNEEYYDLSIEDFCNIRTYIRKIINKRKKNAN